MRLRNPLYRYYPLGRRPRFKFQNPFRDRRVEVTFDVPATGRFYDVVLVWDRKSLRITTHAKGPHLETFYMASGDSLNLKLLGDPRP